MKGLGMAAANWRSYTDAEMQAAIDLAPEGFLFIAFPGDPTQRDRVAQEAELCRAIGNMSPHVRMLLPNSMSLSPSDLAFEMYMLYRLYVAAGLNPSWSPWNEVNIPGERGLPLEAGLQEDWHFQIEYAREFLAYLRMRVPDIRVYIPALSPQGGYLEGLGHYMTRLTGYDGVAIHAYSYTDLLDAQMVKDFTGKAAVITEYNQVPVHAVLAGGFESYYFILDSADPAFDRFSLMKNPALFAEFKAGLVAPEEEPMPEEYIVGEGIFNAMDAYEDAPVEDEWDLVRNRLRACAGLENFYTYSFASNEVYVSPKA